MVSHAKIGTSAIQTRATAGVANATYIFCLPGSPGACRDAWDEILVHQLDYRYRPCNFVEIMPRLDEHLRRAEGQGRDGVASDGRRAPGFCHDAGVRPFAVITRLASGEARNRSSALAASGCLAPVPTAAGNTV